MNSAEASLKKIWKAVVGKSGNLSQTAFFVSLKDEVEGANTIVISVTDEYVQFKSLTPPEEAGSDASLRQVVWIQTCPLTSLRLVVEEFAR